MARTPPPRVPLGLKRLPVGVGKTVKITGRTPGAAELNAELSRVAFRAGIYAVDRGRTQIGPYQKPIITGVPIGQYGLPRKYGVPIGQYDPDPPPKPKK